MLIIHSISGKVIDVEANHASMLKTQGWVDHKETKHDIALEKEAPQATEEVLKKRGRPKIGK